MKIDMRGLREIAKGHRWDLALLIVVTLVCGRLVGTFLAGRGAIAKAVGKDSATPLAVPDPIHLSGTFASIAQAVEPAVVNISTTQVRRAPRQEGPFGEDHFFDFRDMGPMAEHSLGSGVIVDKKGYILTNDHVVHGATKIQVQLEGESTKHTAKVVGTDDETDLAVLKIHADRDLRSRSWAIQTASASGTGCWRLVVRLGCAPPLPPASSARKTAAASAGNTNTSCRPTRRLTRATPAGRWWTWPGK